MVERPEAHEVPIVDLFKIRILGGMTEPRGTALG